MFSLKILLYIKTILCMKKGGQTKSKSDSISRMDHFKRKVILIALGPQKYLWVPWILRVYQKPALKSEPFIKSWEYKESSLVSSSNNGPWIASKGLK